MAKITFQLARDLMNPLDDETLIEGGKTVKKSSDRFLFRQAMPEDSTAILELLEDSDFKGSVSLLYTRRPNAYASLRQESEPIWMAVCEDTEKHTLVALGCCSLHNLYIDGIPKRVGYLSSLRVKKTYQKHYALLANGYGYMKSTLDSLGAELHISTILNDNIGVKRMLTKPRSFMPEYRSLGGYKVYGLMAERRKRKNLSINMRRAKPSDRTALMDFYKTVGNDQQLFPVMQPILDGSLEKNGLAIDDFIILSDHAGTVVAVGAIWDQTSYRQYIVEGYQGMLKYLYPLGVALEWMGYPRLPNPGQTLMLRTLSFLLLEPQNISRNWSNARASHLIQGQS